MGQKVLTEEQPWMGIPPVLSLDARRPRVQLLPSLWLFLHHSPSPNPTASESSEPHTGESWLPPSCQALCWPPRAFFSLYIYSLSLQLAWRFSFSLMLRGWGGMGLSNFTKTKPAGRIVRFHRDCASVQISREVKNLWVDMNKWGRMSETKLPSEPENQSLLPQTTGLSSRRWIRQADSQNVSQEDQVVLDLGAEPRTLHVNPTCFWMNKWIDEGLVYI